MDEHERNRERLRLLALRARWIEKHGSERLRKASALGLLAESVGVYRDERLAVELPGWVWQGERDKVSPIFNPSEPALDLLAKVREQFPMAKLVSVSVRSGADAGLTNDPPEWQEAVSVADPFGLDDRCPNNALRFVDVEGRS
jgi:hypothetical protein